MADYDLGNSPYFGFGFEENGFQSITYLSVSFFVSVVLHLNDIIAV